MVEGGRAQANANGHVRVQRRLGNILAEAKLFQTAVRIDGERSHPILPRHGYNSPAPVGALYCMRPPASNALHGMIPIKVPPLGESIVEATISRWLKKEGESVAAGETVVELETDKVTVEVPATTSGVLVRRAAQEGDVVALGALLGELDESAAGKAAAPPVPQPAAPQARPPAPPPAPAKAAAPAPAPAPAPSLEAVRASPGARRLATDEGIDLAKVAGTGRGGVVSKPDVVEHAARATTVAEPQVRVAPPAPVPTPAPPAPPAPAAPAAPVAPPAPSRGNGARETREKMSTRRKRIAEHLLEAQHATAHLTTFNEIDMSVVESLRARVKERIEKEHGVRLSFMPFFVRAAARR